MTVPNPATVYLSRWSTKSDTFKTMRSALRSIAEHVVKPGHVTVDILDAVNWGALRQEDVRRLPAELADAGLKPPTINKLLSALRGVLETAWRLGQIPDEEYRRLEIENVAGKALPAGRALEAEEVDVIHEKLPNEAPRDGALIAVLVGCGLRRIELVRLHGGDYDPATGELRALGKGNKERAIPVPPRWRPFVARWFALLSRNEPAFDVSRSGVSYIISEFVRRHELRPFTPHDLRRAYITQVSEKADLGIAQRLAGHANISTTTIYDRRGKAAEKKAVEDL